MTTPPEDLMDTVRRDLASWHATHPDATFADLETAVEDKIRHLRTALLAERTEAVRQEDHPACARCGTTMIPRSRSSRTVVMPGEEAIPVERT